ncbi:MAG: class I tRNA ligase family protein, partial [Rickettsiales bacterium]|nr:class I tRNA ligase family protein [Rickettsiales bacterium]
TQAGVQRFLKRVENMQITDAAPNEFLQHQLIRDVTERIENMQFNTAISAMMSYINEFSTPLTPASPGGSPAGGAPTMPRGNYETLIQMLNPFAPHLTEEIWEKLGHTEMLVFAKWPVADETKLVKKSVSVSVSVNGKFRGTADVAPDADEKTVVAAAMPIAEKFITGEIIKTIYVPNRMINFVVK